MAADFSESANALIADVLQGHAGRNNIAVKVENGSKYEWDISHYIAHGVKNAYKGSSILNAVDPSAPNAAPTTFELGLVALGTGCNIAIILASPTVSDKFVIIVATPAGKESYCKLYTSTIAEKTTEDYWDKADAKDEHQSSDGWAVIKSGGVHIKVLVTGASPAAAFIEIYND